jgi:hypothetical protein
VLLAAAMFGLACSDDTTSAPIDGGGQEDAKRYDGPRDGIAPRDGGANDAGIKDAIAADVGQLDGSADSGSADSGSVDSGVIGGKAACAAKSAAIHAKTGTTIVVKPAASGKVTIVGQLQQKTLRQVVSSASAGDIILLEDGTYTFNDAPSGSYSGLYFTKANVVMRSKSGNREAVILDSNYADHGGQTAVISVDAPGVVLADFTVKRSIFHLIHLWAKGDKVVIHNVAMIDGGQQFIKASPGSSASVDDVEVTCSSFVMTSAGRDNVWGYGSQTGGTRCYTGGIDTHDSRNWLVADNYFEGIYCNAAGVQRPAHGKKASLRNSETYTGGLSEHAIHMWDSAQGSAHIIERNQIVNCARGIGIGLRDDVYGTIVRNNMIFSKHAGGGEHDVGINIDRGHNVSVLNNTVFLSSPQAYDNAIEYRYDVSSGLQIKNNLTNKRIHARDNAKASLAANVQNAKGAWFVDPAAGDLHLRSCSQSTVAGKAVSLGDIKDDIDGDPRGASSDIGADQCVP